MRTNLPTKVFTRGATASRVVYNIFQSSVVEGEGKLPKDKPYKYSSDGTLRIYKRLSLRKDNNIININK